MDESPSDVDQLFKERHTVPVAWRTFSTPLRRSKGARSYAGSRRRRNALSGLVVLVAVVVFLVPLPQLHLFGTGGTASTTGTRPGTSPLGSTSPTTAVTGIGPRGV